MWVSFLERNDPFNAATEALLQWLQAATTPYDNPEFALLEIACAMARRRRHMRSGQTVARLLRRNSRLRLIETREWLTIAEELGCQFFLRGADALYAATAHLTKTPWLAWDRELSTAPAR